MAIATLRKITLIGRAAAKDEIVAGMQRLACMHVLDLAGENRPPPWEHPAHSDLFAALKYLQQCPTKRPTAEDDAGIDLNHIAEEVLENQQRHRALEEELESLQDAIAQSEPWGEFEMPPPESLGGQNIWFYRLRHRQLADVPAEVARQVISRDREFSYVVVIAPQAPESLPKPLELDARPLSELRKRLSAVEQEIEENEVQRIAFTRWIAALGRGLSEAEQQIERVHTAAQLFRDDPVFAMQGWVPLTNLPALKKYAKEQSLVMVTSQPQSDDAPPTLLKNPSPIDGAEDTVTFFMTPRYGTWDPTLVMYLSFSLFFAMIMADAGYGLLLAVGLLAFSARLRNTESGRRFRNLVTFMVAATIIYGVMIGSYFGMAPPKASLLDRLVVKSEGVSIVNHRETMMLISASIGVFHLALANLIVAVQKFGSAQALSNVGWVAFLFGGWMMVLGQVPQPSTSAWLADQFGGAQSAWSTRLWSGGQWLLVGGLVMVWFFSSQRPLFSARPVDWLMRPVDGLLGLTNVTKAFGDALSYLRLFALGLASGQLAMIFNQLASDVSELRGVGLLLGVLIFVVGHSLNIVLAIVGGVVHGLRLNCIEFFSWSLREEGRPFQAFGEQVRN